MMKRRGWVRIKASEWESLNADLMDLRERAEKNAKLTDAWAEHADWCDANEWDIPITMGHDIREAIQVIGRLYHLLSCTTVSIKPVKGNDVWKYVGIDMQTHEYPEVIWECRRCGYQRLAGWTPPYYNCPECTGRDQNTQKDGTTHD